MRRLHVVAKHEQFVASGQYTHYEGDAPSGLVEEWSIHEVGGGALFVRVDADGRDYDGRSMLLEALLAPEGHFERIDRHEFLPGASEAVITTTIFYEDHIDITQASGEMESLPFPSEGALWLGGWILLGLAAAQAELMLLWNSAESPRLVAAVNETGSGSVSVAGHDTSARSYRLGDADSRLWLDDHQVLLQLESGRETTVLKEYARRPETQH